MKRLFSAFLITSAFGLSAASALANPKEKWVCNKDGAEQKVKGKKPADKQKDCEKQGGTWEKAAAKEEAAPEAAEQSSGGGGSW